jgi:hypothetical protein
MHRDPRAKELASLKQALANFEHQLDACQSKAPQVRCLAPTDPRLASTDPQIVFANEVVAAMKNRLTDGRAMAGMRQGELS